MMTTPNANDGFEHDDSRVVVSVKEVDVKVQKTGMVALLATILDPESLMPTGTQLVVQMLPEDAFKFATTVHDTAKTEAWAFPANAKFVKWREDRSEEE
jgi:hypothetical protein